MIALAGAVALATAVLALPGAPAAAPSAVASWSMVPLAKDADGDGTIDGDGGVPARRPTGLEPSSRMVGAGNRIAQPHERLIGGSLSWYLPDGGLPVRLDACRSRGEQLRWTVDGETTAWQPLTRKRCARTVQLVEGTHAVTLEVRSGRRVSTAALDVDAVHHLVVSMGDSYASGEGNPRNVGAWLRDPGPFAPYWDDAGCRRSALSGPARAALALERSSTRSSVTFVDVSCSGATVDAGILGPQPGTAASQVEQVRRIVGDRPLDAVLLSVGGNDIGFGTVIETCLLRSDCPVARAASGPLRAYPTLQDGIQARTAELPAKFARIAACLGGAGTCALAGPGADAPLRMAPGAPVIPALYPDLTRAADGAPCTLLAMDADDFAWARASMLVPQPQPSFTYRRSNGASVALPLGAGTLNSQVLATTSLGWQPATGFWEASGESPEGHGLCAGNRAWIYGITALAGFPSASFHPDPDGQARLGDALADALAAALPTGPAPR